MASVPKIDSPCPFKDRLGAVMEGDFCTQCNRQVTDLSAMIESEREAFLASCTGEICVSYTLRPAIAAAALATAALTVPTAAAATTTAPTDYPNEIIIVVGGINDPANTEMIDDGTDADVPELPVIYEDDDATEEADQTVI